MTPAKKQLLFNDVDGLAFAAARGHLGRMKGWTAFSPQRLGPLLELLHLAADGLIPAPGCWLAANGTGPMISALAQNKESWAAQDEHAGFIRGLLRSSESDSRLTGFLMRAKRAGRNRSGLSAAVSGQLVAAMRELEDNIREHADAPETGILAYKAEPGAFEFVVGDRGIGVLRSLRRCPLYAGLRDEGKALQTALADGVSRHGLENNRGHGFRPIFIGLMNLHGELRFRSGDHAIAMNGIRPTLATSRLIQKAPMNGFFASVRCLATHR